MKLFKISKITAIISAILFFIFSTIHLIKFGVSQNAIKKSDHKIIEIVINNYKNFNISLILLFTFSFLIILFSYYKWAKVNKQKVPKILSIIVIIALIINTLYQFTSYLTFLNYFPIGENTPNILLSLSSILFAISLLIYKKNRSTSILAIAPLYLINSIFTFSTIFIPIQLIDLTIAIRIVEAVFFSQEKL